MATEALRPDIAIPPGEFLEETLEAIGMSQAELARRTGRPAQVINEIVKGTKEITADTALQFEKVLDTPAQFWLNLERDYRLVLARIAEQRALEEQAALVTEFPYAEMVKQKLVQKVRSASQKVLELLKFFGVSSLAQVPSMRVPAAAFRKAGGEKASSYALAAWLRWGEVKADSIEVGTFDINRLRQIVHDIRGMTSDPPGDALKRLEQRLAACGVALVVVPHFPKTYAQGATFWVGDKAVVMMSLRYKWADIFWFSLLHELAHVILHGKRDIFIEGDVEPTERIRVQEEEADRLAQEALIPPQRYRDFVLTRDFSSATVRVFAISIGVAPGIVVGRLQHDKHLGYADLPGLRERYVWEEV
ncbi:MAG: HigA family addiction module antidote protein [Pleurocapsa sp. SU_196_0]|nr:HigA family addiction module antidote protein [Pleurocapsa sp. SU_196_0]